MSLIAESTTLAPFEIWEVPLDDERTIKFNEPLILTPTWMPDDPDEPRAPGAPRYLDVICPKLNIDVYADNFDDLIEAVKYDIQLIWERIVLKPDGILSKKARIIKQNHLAIAEVIDE